ncbi:MAG: ABC-type sugar transport system, permease component [Capsulimonas sp.]|nr:ABC-type sugar transport system, permease component [Capsulimonas sp.]
MNILVWLVIIVACYCALGFWVANIMRAFRMEHKAKAGVLLVLPVVAFLLDMFLSPPTRITAFVAMLAIGTAVASKVLTPKENLIPEREMKTSLLHLLLVSGSALFLIPFFWMVLTSLKEDSQMNRFPPEFIPTQQVMTTLNGKDAGLVWITNNGKRVKGAVKEVFPDGMEDIQILNGGSLVHLSKADVTEIRHFAPVWKNYPDALKFLPKANKYGLVNLQNTLIIALLSVVGTTLSSSLVAYGFSRLKWPGRDWLFGLVLATMMLPDAVTMMPRFLIFRSLHWVDTLYPMWVPSFFAAAFNVFLLRQFFMGIPKELEDAAKIDGCNYLTTYWRVMLPMVKPSLAAVSIMTFIGAWKDFMGPLIYISTPEKMPLTYVLQLFQSAHGGNPGMLMAFTTMVMLPVIVLFFFTQRYFIEGVSLTGLGGR